MHHPTIKLRHSQHLPSRGDETACKVSILKEKKKSILLLLTDVNRARSPAGPQTVVESPSRSAVGETDERVPRPLKVVTLQDRVPQGEFHPPPRWITKIGSRVRGLHSSLPSNISHLPGCMEEQP